MNKDVSVTLIGASRLEQLLENLQALELMKKWTPALEEKLEEIMQTRPEPALNWRLWQPLPHRRQARLDWQK